MASHHIDAGRASALPLNLLAQAIPMLSRHELARLTERLIDRLDAIDPDPDSEDDDPDTGVEDDPVGFDREEDLSELPYGIDQSLPISPI
jgi:hypothetical protein